MLAIDLIRLMEKYAQNYHSQAGESIQRNRHMNDIKEGEEIDKRHIEAVLVDFINFAAGRNGIDFAMYTKDLVEADPTTSK